MKDKTMQLMCLTALLTLPTCPVTAQTPHTNNHVFKIEFRQDHIPNGHRRELARQKTWIITETTDDHSAYSGMVVHKDDTNTWTWQQTPFSLVVSNSSNWTLIAGTLQTTLCECLTNANTAI